MNNLKEQYISIKTEIDSAIQRVLNSGQYILGNEVAEFEKEWADYCGVKYGVGVGSGTDAIHLALRGLGIGKGDKVLTVPNTTMFSIMPIILAGATPCFVDVNEYYLMDVNKIRITKRIKAIMPVHLYGQCADMYPINKIADKYGLKVIEDACQAHGSTCHSMRAGSLGDCGCFSFYPTKNLGGYGDGGMVVTSNKKLRDNLLMLRNGGQRVKNKAEIFGVNSRLDELQAAILRTKLQYLDSWNFLRQIKTVPYGFSNGHLHVTRTIKRTKDSVVHYPIPIHLQPAFKFLGYKKGDFPMAEKYAKEITTII